MDIMGRFSLLFESKNGRRCLFHPRAGILVGFCAPAVVAAHAPLEQSAPDDGLVVVPGQLVKEYGILPSMSRRRNCYDNALAENFFGILKTEYIYRRKPETFEEANKRIDDYIYFYNHERIQLKTGLSPLSLRQSG